MGRGSIDAKAMNSPTVTSRGTIKHLSQTPKRKGGRREEEKCTVDEG